MDLPEKKYQSLKDYIVLSLKGFGMGVADVIPGISGGTIAFIAGIYEDLINALRSFDVTFVKLLLSFKIKEALAGVAWRFLAFLFGGIIGAIFSLSKVISWLLMNQPVLVHAFFFGLILATVPIIARSIKIHNKITIIVALAAAVATYALVGRVPVQTPIAGWFLFLSGVIAICAMILPGISGAYILVLMGKYQYIIDAVSQHDFGVLVIVALGCLVGILTFVRVLHWLLVRYHDLTVAILTGMVLGSLRKIWPWKETVSAFTTAKGKFIPIVQHNMLPTQWNLEVGLALLLIIVGFTLALILSRQTPKQFVQ